MKQSTNITHQGLTAFKQALHDLNQLKRCVHHWVSAGYTSVIISNERFSVAQPYTLTISTTTVTLVFRSPYYTLKFQLNLKTGTIYKNDTISSAKCIVLLTNHVQDILQDVLDQKATVCYQEVKGGQS